MENPTVVAARMNSSEVNRALWWPDSVTTTENAHMVKHYKCIEDVHNYQWTVELASITVRIFQHKHMEEVTTYFIFWAIY